jgi:hypothetical protein
MIRALVTAAAVAGAAAYTEDALADQVCTVGIYRDGNRESLLYMLYIILLMIYYELSLTYLHLLR